MIFILLLSLFYICLTVASSQLLLSLSVPVLLLLTYLLPPIVNSICMGLQKISLGKRGQQAFSQQCQ